MGLLVGLVWLAVGARTTAGTGIGDVMSTTAASATSSEESGGAAAIPSVGMLEPSVGDIAPAPTPLALVLRAPARPLTYLIARITSPKTVTSFPGRGRLIGVLPTHSRWITRTFWVWVMDVSQDGRYGEVAIPWSPSHAIGWFDLRGLPTKRIRYMVVVSLSKHQLTLFRSGKRLFTAPAAIGAPVSPTPPGIYYVTDRSPWNRWSGFGSFIFGISGIQTHLPPGWSGGDVLAIHGTNDPGSIGRAASAGCLRVSEWTLERLEPLVILGTPVIITR